MAMNAISMPPKNQLRILAGPASFAATMELNNQPDPIIQLKDVNKSPTELMSFFNAEGIANPNRNDVHHDISQFLYQLINMVKKGFAQDRSKRS